MTARLAQLAVALTVAIATVVAAPAPARADGRSEAEALFRAGEKAFEAAQYAAAADAFEQALAKLPLPAIAFSTAQAHRLQYFVDNQPQHLQRAVTLYHAYIDEQKTGGRVADAVANLAQIEPLLAELTKAGVPKTAALPVDKAARIVVVADVASARAAIDNDSGPVPFVHDVEPGDHTITVTADGYATFTRKATAVPGEMVPVEVQLVAKPAVVGVGGPAGAHVSVDARPLGDAPLRGIELPAGRHAIAITERGHVPFVRDLELARGQTLALDPQLPTTRQRRAVPWVAGGAGALAIAAGVTGILAHSAQSDAETQSATLARGGANASVVTKYNDDLADRHARLHDTELLAGASGAVLLTAALLYVFDHPSPEAPPPAPVVPIAPMVGPKAAGLVLGGRF